MLIERDWLDNYNSALRGISDGGQQALREQLRTVDYDRPMDEVRQDVTNIMEAVCATSTQSAALTSAGWYDGLRERSVGQSMGAAADTGRNPASTAASVRAFLQRIIEGDYDAFEDLMCERLSYEVIRSAGNCVAANTRRDPHEVRYARVPQGDKTCGFCLMLASRGPVYYTEESAGMYLKYHAHCVTGDTKVCGTGLQACLRREYKGPLVNITTTRGRSLSVTPNHPIMTTRGWRLAGDLHEGESLICARFSHGHEIGIPDIQNVPPTAKELFESASFINSTRLHPVPATAEYFDGEVGTECDIEVIDADGLLVDAFDATSTEPREHETLTPTRGNLTAPGSLFDADGTSNLLGLGNNATPDSIMGSSCLCRAFGGSHFGSPHETSGATVSKSDAILREPSGDYVSTNVEPVCDCVNALTALVGFNNSFRHSDALSVRLDTISLQYSVDGRFTDADDSGNLARTFSGLIEVDNVLSLDVTEVSCHVYDLSTRGGWYFSSGILTHNCDCAIVPFFDTVPVYAEDGHYLGRRSADELEGYNPDELYRRYVHEMLSPQKPPSERPGYHPSGGERTYAAQWGRAYNEGRVTMGSIGEVSHAIRNAATYQELFDLIQLINKELEWYGASADVIRMWQRDLIAARNRLIA